MKVFIRPDTAYYNIVKYVLRIMEKNIGSSFVLCSMPEEATLCWDHENPASEPLSLGFYESLQREDEGISL